MERAHRYHGLQTHYVFEELVRIRGDKSEVSDFYLIQTVIVLAFSQVWDYACV